MKNTLFVIGAAVAACFGWSGSAYAISGPSVPERVVEQKASDALSKKYGERAKVDCPQPLPAKVGESITCKLVAAGGKRFGVTATVKAVNGDNVSMHFKVIDAPKRQRLRRL